VGLIYEFAEDASLSFGYVADDANEPEEGIDGGSYGTISQLTFRSNEPEASIFNYAVTLAFADFGKEGNVAGFVIGQPPKLTDNDYEDKGEKYKDEGTSLHLEAFYLFQATQVYW
jgi:superfamily I DNA and/or RNA helicase